jgi:hypothetical protein
MELLISFLAFAVMVASWFMLPTSTTQETQTVTTPATSASKA